MAIANNSNTNLGIIKETVLGTTPLTPLLVQQPFSSFSLNPTTAELTDTRKTGSREISAVVTGNTTFSGNLNGPLSYGNYDLLFESAMFGAWNTNVLKVGSTRTTFALELARPDITLWTLYNGLICNGFTIDSPAEGLTTVQFDLQALDMNLDNATASTGPYTPATLNDPFKSCTGVVSEGGVPIAYVSSVNLTLTNNINPLNFWGDCNPGEYSVGNADITGTLSLFFADDTVLAKYLAGTYSSLSFTLTDGAGNDLTFFLPRIKYTGATADVAEGSGESLLSLPFRAVKNVTEGTGLQITRTPA